MLPQFPWGAQFSPAGAPSPAWCLWMHLGSHKLWFCFYHLWISLNPRKEVSFCSKQPLDDCFRQSVCCNLSPCMQQESAGLCLSKACTRGTVGVAPVCAALWASRGLKGVCPSENSVDDSNWEVWHLCFATLTPWRLNNGVCLAVNKFILPFNKNFSRNDYESIFENWGTQGVKSLLLSGGPSQVRAGWRETVRKKDCTVKISWVNRLSTWVQEGHQTGSGLPRKGNKARVRPEKERLWPEALFKAWNSSQTLHSA